VRAGTAAPIVEKLYREVQAVLKSPEVVGQFEREGASAVAMSSAEFAKFIEAETAKWGRVIKESNIKPQ